MMMRMLRKDLSRGKVVAATLLLFVLLSALLTAGGLRVVAELTGSMNALFERAIAPHFVQMHAGEIDQAAIDTFTAGQPMVVDQQTVEMLNVAGAHLYLTGDTSEAGSVMENAFVVQNERFDLLLDLNNEAIDLQPGEIGVPIYHMQQVNLRLGDTVRLRDGSFDRSFTIAAFVRDVQMNPSLVTSKRFVVHPDDWRDIKGALGESEYLIEFLLDDPALAGEFEALYQASGLPQKDTAITWSLYRLLSALTDGLLVAVLILVALLLMAIALLCLRFTIVAAMEQDLREIGVMKAIGLPARRIRRLYMVKYTALAGVGCLAGLLLSLPLSDLLSSNIALYMGRAERSAMHLLLPAAGALGVFLLVWVSCRGMLRRIRRISAVDALRAGSTGGKHAARGLRLHRRRGGSVNLLLGARDVLGHPRQYAVLCLVFVLSVFLMVLPLNLLTTVESPDFTAYMGAARSDIRIDLTRSDGVGAEFERLLAELAQDPDIAVHAAFVTAAYKVENSAGNLESIKIETGDFSAFPLEYLEGAAPAQATDIALSLMNADELGKGVGDTLTVLVDGAPVALRVCGLYQDVTNGGKTAKALLPWQADDVLWYVINADLAPGVELQSKIAELRAAFPSARVTDMDEYLRQTLGGLTDRLRVAAGLSAAVALFLAVCITALFFRMLLAKDAREIAILTALGFTRRDIGRQYATRALLVLLAGVALGTLAVNTLGEGLAGALGGMLGASRIQFAVNPLLAWLLCPLLLAGAVALTTLLCSKSTAADRDLRTSME